MTEGQTDHRLYRLRIIDEHATAYVICGAKGDVGCALDWLENSVGEQWLRLSGFDDEADRRPITVLIARESIKGMLLTRV